MRLPRRASATSPLGLLALLVLGCNPSTGPSDGMILVRIATAGLANHLDPDGYLLVIDGQPGQPVATNGEFRTDLRPGDHEVRLDGVARNCAFDGPDRRTFSVVAGRQTDAPIYVPFTVVCGPRSGSIRVTATTTGEDQDPDGYTVTVAGREGQLLPNGSLLFGDIVEGAYQAWLGGIAPNCVVDGESVVPVTVVGEARADLSFVVRCVAAGRLRATVRTTGVALDPDGYTLEVRHVATGTTISAPVSPNGTTTVEGMQPGAHLVKLRDMAPNCDPTRPAADPVNITATSEATLTIDVTCEVPRQLAFVVTFGANAEIFLGGATGQGLTQLTDLAAADTEPAWSPDGSRLAFATERHGAREIYVMNANGGNPVRLTNHLAQDYHPAWSPDGARIAFVSERDGNAEIYVMHADGTNLVRLTNNPASDLDPAWSPDGSRLAFTSLRNGSPRIFLMHADGSQPSQLTDQTDGQPAWSPDGTRIAFSRTLSTNIREIFVVNADGTELSQLTSLLTIATDPAWSPDGRKIALGSYYCHYYYYDYCESAVRVVRIDGTPQTLPNAFSNSRDPAWRP